MALMIWYLVFVAAGDALSYFVGLLVEYAWGSYASLIVFLVLYFATLWVAWVVALWLTEPKAALPAPN